MSFNYGDEVFRDAGNTIFVGKFIGLAKRLNGEMNGIAETTHGLVFMGPLHTFKHINAKDKDITEGQVVIKDRENEPAIKVLPPLKSSKK